VTLKAGFTSALKKSLYFCRELSMPPICLLEGASNDEGIAKPSAAKQELVKALLAPSQRRTKHRICGTVGLRKKSYET
jgi:hypothetical protein